MNRDDTSGSSVLASNTPGFSCTRIVAVSSGLDAANSKPRTVAPTKARAVSGLAAAPGLADPDMAWNNLERFLSAARSPVSTAALFEREPESLANLLQLFAASQYVSDLLVVDHGGSLQRVIASNPTQSHESFPQLLSETDLFESVPDHQLKPGVVSYSVNASGWNVRISALQNRILRKMVGRFFTTSRKPIKARSR